MTLVNDFQNIIAAYCSFKAKLQPPKSRWKGQDLCKFPGSFWYFDKATQPYHIFPLISIFDMCTARDDCSNLVHDFFYLQLEAPLTQLSFVRKSNILPPFHHFIAMFLGWLWTWWPWEGFNRNRPWNIWKVWWLVPGSQGWIHKDGGMDASKVRQSEVPMGGMHWWCFFVQMLRCYFLHLRHGLFGFAIWDTHI